MKAKMSTQKTLKEIIGSIKHSALSPCITCDAGYEHPALTNIQIDQAISEIKSLIKEKLPKEIDMKYTEDRIINILRDIRNEYGCGYNQCLTEIEQILEAL